jgi:5-methyltetrahydropteroyltriglutamate--homocysteine methyltransferase
MQLSEQRILTTHVGSLPRSPGLTDLLIRREAGDRIDERLLETEIDTGISEAVRRQIEAGVDIVNDGEQPRPGFQTYVVERMRGFGGESRRPRSIDYANFPKWAEQMLRRFPSRAKISNAPQCVGDVSYHGVDQAIAECDAFERAAQPFAGRYAGKFMTAASPGIIATTMLNAWYDSHERYVFALAREMRKEYEAIIARGFTLQIDAPDLAMERTVLFQDRSLPDFLDIVEMHVAAINEAIRDVPRERVRLHACYGNWEGPHTCDAPLADVLPRLTQARVGALSLEFANPRHQHEIDALAQVPAGMAVIPGVIDSTTNYVEHPEVVANRICAAVRALGDRFLVIAGTDCGFGTFAGFEHVAPDVVWAKLASCAEGAKIATKRLWGNA